QTLFQQNQASVLPSNQGQNPLQQLQTTVLNRSVTPSHPSPSASPVISRSQTPASSPHINSRSMTPSQTSTVSQGQGQQQVLGNIAGQTNLNVFQIPSNTQSPLLARGIQLQGINPASSISGGSVNLQGQTLQGLVQTSQGQTYVQGQGQTAVLQGQGQNIVNTQNTVIQNPNIGNHILNLNLTPAQKEKVEGYLSKMSPEQQQQQISMFLKLQQQQQLQAQVQAQVKAQQSKILIQQQGKTVIQTASTNIPLTVQAGQKVVDTGQTVIINTPGKPQMMIKRVSVASIPKSQLILQQLHKDQENALKPDTKTPYRSRRDTYRRLLRYHVYQSKHPPKDAIDKDSFEPLPMEVLLRKTTDNVKEEIKTEPECAIKQELIDDNEVGRINSPSIHDIKTEENSSRPSTPKVKLVIRNDGQNFSSSIRESLSSDTEDSSQGQNVLIGSHDDEIDVEMTDCTSPLLSGIKSKPIEVDEPVDRTADWSDISVEEKPFSQYMDAHMDDQS
ncbi:hypothetical protein FSP39_019068, partial [Pinctada imbricata]